MCLTVYEHICQIDLKRAWRAQVDKLEDQAHVRRLVEVVLAPRSELVHKTVRETKFRSQFNAAIIGVHRHVRKFSLCHFPFAIQT